mgnify:CR=1 FL=1
MLKSSERVCGLLGLAKRAGKVVFGTEACMQAIEKNKVNLIIIATNAAERTKMNFNHICINKGISIKEYLSIEEISKAIGSVNKAVIGIKDTNFSNEIKKIINGGEAIG